MVESSQPSSKYTPSYLRSQVGGASGSRKIYFVLINESDQPLNFVDQYNYHGKMLETINGIKIPPGGVAEWSACKQDYTLYGTEIYTVFSNP